MHDELKVESVKASKSTQPLAGVRAIVIGQAIAGPTTGRFLANYGADVIRVEWSGHVDRLRYGAPSATKEPNINSSARFAQYNTELKSIGLNLREAAGREVFKDLCRQSHVLVCNYGAHVLPSLGLDPETLLKVNPKLIVAMLTLFGEGRYASQPGLGGGLAAYSGFCWMTGWPDAEPLVPQGAYTDFIVPPFTVMAILAALEAVESGEPGRVLDVSQFECGTWFLMPELMAAQLSTRPQVRQGFSGGGWNVSFVAPCLGDDRWCVLTVASDEQWFSICEVMNRTELKSDPRFSSASSRLQHRDAVATEVSDWTCKVSREEVIDVCRRAGVLAVPVADARDLQSDPALAERGHWRQVGTTDTGRPLFSERFPLSFSGFEATAQRAPGFSEHAHEILKELLQYTDSQVGDLVSQGAVE